MVSLFSVFDPVALLGFSFNWLIIVIMFLMFPLGYYFLVGKVKKMFLGVENYMNKMVNEISFPNQSGLVLIGVVCFFCMGFMNFLGLFSYVFTATGHLMVTFSAGLVMWMMSILMGWLKEFKESSAHLVPEGSPMILAPFMVVIETISMLIRPFTLSVRLAANMMAGHLIIGLMASISMVSYSVFWLSVLLQSVMMILELAVCFIQAFVFSVLVILYALDFY